MNLQYARVWFRFKGKISAHIKGNKSSMYRNDMECRYCENETQEHFTKEMRKTFDLTQETDQLVLWRKLTRALKDVHNKNNKRLRDVLQG